MRTFLAALTAFVSVALILFFRELHMAWTISIMMGWVLDVVDAGCCRRMGLHARLIGGCAAILISFAASQIPEA